VLPVPVEGTLRRNRTGSDGSGNDQLFWCNRTQTCLGPDGQAVNDFECKTGRSCYEAF
jgi:hypothetical protein